MVTTAAAVSELEMVGSGEATLPPMVRVDDVEEATCGMVGMGCSFRMKKRDDEDGEPAVLARFDARRGEMPLVSSMLQKPTPAEV